MGAFISPGPSIIQIFYFQGIQAVPQKWKSLRFFESKANLFLKDLLFSNLTEKFSPTYNSSRIVTFIIII